MSDTLQLWLLATLLPGLTLLGQNMCVWPVPRFLGPVALFLLWWSVSTGLFFLAALPLSIYFLAAGLINWRVDGELVRQASHALACICFAGLWILSLRRAISLRRQAFVRASHAGDRIVRALAQYRNDKGEYPNSLEELVPAYVERVPYTGLIAYPTLDYAKDRNDNQAVAGSYDLRIWCSTLPVNFDRFLYWPSETYPDRIQDKPVERIRQWAYVHE